jgi:hypothetical protein
MTTPIPPADEAEFEAWASDGDPNSEPLMTKDGMMSIERAARNGFFAGLAVGRRTTHPPAQHAADPETECALAVGRYVYARLEAIFDAKADTPQGRELQYLAAIIADVEEYGATGEETGATRGAEVFGSFQ